MKRLIFLFLTMLIAGVSSAAIVYTDIVDQTTSVEGGGTISAFSLTGDAGDSFAFNIQISGPYPTWVDGLTTMDDSQIAMANGHHAFLGAGADVASQSTWVGGLLSNGSSFLGFGSDVNGWLNNTGYVGLRVAQGGGNYIYGWAEFTLVQVADPQERSMTLTRYAYEDQVNTSIAAGAVPEPASVTMLLIGGGVIGLMRRKLFS